MQSYKKYIFLYFCWLNFCLAKAVTELDLKDHKTNELRTDAELLDYILDTVHYNGMLRPDATKNKPVDVFVSLYVSSLSDINLIQQSMRLDLEKFETFFNSV